MKKKILLLLLIIIFVFVSSQNYQSITAANSDAWYNSSNENLTTSSRKYLIESIPDGANGTTIPNKRYAIDDINSDTEAISNEYIDTVQNSYYLNFYRTQVVFNNMKSVFDENGMDTGEVELDPNFNYSNTPYVNYGTLEMSTNIPNLSSVTSPELSCQLTYKIGLDDDAEEIVGPTVTGDDVWQLENGRILIELDTSMDLESNEYIRRITQIKLTVGRDNLDYYVATNILFQYSAYETYKDTEMKTYVKYTDTRSENPVTIDNWYTLFKNPLPRTIATFSMNDINTGSELTNITSIHAKYDYCYLDVIHKPDFFHPTKKYYTDKVTYEATQSDFLNQVLENFNSENEEKSKWDEFWSSDNDLNGYAGLVNDKYKADTELNASDYFSPSYMWVWNGMKISDFQPLYATQTIAPGVTSYHSFLTDGAIIVKMKQTSGETVVKVVDASGQIRDDMVPLDAENSSIIIYKETGELVESIVDSEYVTDNKSSIGESNLLTDYSWLNDIASIGSWMTSNANSIVSIGTGLLGIIILVLGIVILIKFGRIIKKIIFN